MIKFGVLGPVGVERGEGPLDLSAMPQRMLALFLSFGGAPISLDALVDAMWEEQPPPSARKTVQVYAHRLRRILGDERVRHSAAGYALDIRPGELDAHVFESLVEQSRTSGTRGDWENSYQRLTEALALWRGEAYADVRDCSALDTERVRLADRRLIAIESWAEAGLRADRPEELIGSLTRAVAESPFREGLRAVLMLALYRTGRRVDALALYRHTHRLFTDEFGLEPSARLRRLHEQMLRGDPALDSTSKPRFLPRDVPEFVGRQADIDWLDAMAGGGAPVVISAIAGTAGIGKTALAVHWAHRVAALFPQGHFYVNLRGYDPGPPVRPIDALGQLLRCLGVPPGQVPATLDDAAARYRTLLADKHILLLLDNARSVEQVRPLLPPGDGCLVVVTSRDRLTGLISRDGARRLTLGTLSEQESVELLGRMVGPLRIGADPSGTARLAGLCGGLPLALRIAAAHLADQPHRAISDYAADLADRSRIRTLVVEGDEEYAVGPVLDRSFECLPPQARRVLGLLAVIPGFESTAETVAATADITAAEAVSALDVLAAGHLADRQPTGRYTLHDLIGEYAREHPSRDPEGLRRLLQYLVGGARKAISLMAAGRPYEDDQGPTPEISSAAAAMAWLDNERANLVAAMHAAISGRMVDFAAGIAAPLWRYFQYAERASEWVTTFEIAVSTMERMEVDIAVRYQFLNLLGAGYIATGQLDDALDVHEHCLAGRLESGDHIGAVQSRINIGICHERRGRYADALRQIQTALQDARRLGDRSSQMLLLGSNLPVVLNKMGLHGQARDCLLQAMTMVEESGTPFDLMRVRHHLGDTLVLLGEPALAQPELRSAMRLAKELKDRRMEALSLVTMGVAHRDLGELGQAIELLTQGIALMRQPSYACESWNELGTTYLLAGDLVQARAAHEQALKVSTEIGAEHERARALVGLAKLDREANPVGALALLAEALAMLEGVSATEAEQVRRLIGEIRHAGTGSRRNTA